MYIASYFIGAISILIGFYFTRDLITLLKDKKVKHDEKTICLDENKVYKSTVLELTFNMIILVLGGVFMIILCAPQIVFLEIILFAIVSYFTSRYNDKYTQQR